MREGCNSYFVYSHDGSPFNYDKSWMNFTILPLKAEKDFKCAMVRIRKGTGTQVVLRNEQDFQKCSEFVSLKPRKSKIYLDILD